MATATATPPHSATLPTFPRSPSKDLKPNPHPYAIKTTSTALLSRSNSSGHVTPAHHFYTPPSRSLSRSPTKSKSEYRGHRYSTSLTGELPSPLPGRESPTRSQRSQSEDGASVGSPARRTRAETLPSRYPDDEEPTSASGTDDLPPNPKLWTPSQLSTYLTRALRVRSGETLSVPEPVARDIASWVRKEGVGGRTFLRWEEEELEGLGVNTLWRDALLIASRNLRQNVIRGRIWGTPGSPTSDLGDSPDAPAPHPYSSEMYASSSSSVDLLSDSGEPGITPLRRANGGLRVRRNKGDGRVKGMVDKWERESAGSRSREGSAYGSESEQEDHAPLQDSPSKLPSGLPFFSPDRTGPRLSQDSEELSMEELLATVSEPPPMSGSWGARAWEELELGVTVKHVGENASPVPGMDTVVVKRRDGSGSGSSGRGSVGALGTRRLGSSGRVKAAGADERRVVTAIFAHPPVEEPEDVQETEGALERGKQDAEVQAQLAEEAEALARERALETEIESTRALLEAFRRRLEEVEGRVTEMEERERAAARAEAEEQLKHAERELDVSTDVQETTAGLQQPAAITVQSVFTDVDRDERTAPVANASASTSPSAGDDAGPSAISELPSYVLLVGLGVCAVVLQVVLRRVAGRNLKP
ncbi:hypothetical protein FA95DRAFT_1570569 [Auriscalpium vulgare]|uniref:Uncharacterized protein n=1 Tax=Auriscalpium vulgare TaxID=40419 RepID=A0ACB8S1T8_9AGAM|nr:hypothetical protein FA95DRAFT_1570569 [Auriscalpium vulgare]